MKRVSLKDMTTDDLAERFAAYAFEQDEALFMDEIGRVNKLFDRLEAVELELKTRDGDQRNALLKLFEHENAQVRIKAAKATLAIAPQVAREVLEKIKASKEQPQALEAGMSLWNLDRGVFKPT